MSSSKGVRRRSLPSLLNPFSLFGGTRNSSNHDSDDSKSVAIDVENGNKNVNLRHRTQIQYLCGHTGIVRCLTAIDEDRFASCSDDCLIFIWNIHNGLLLDVGIGHRLSILSLLIIQYKSLKLLISASTDKTIRIWDITNQTQAMQCISILKQHNDPIYKILSFQKTTKLKQNGLISACNNGNIAVWHLNDEYNISNDANNKEDKSNLFNLSRIINIQNEDGTSRQLTICCKNGEIKYIYQLSRDTEPTVVLQCL